MSDIVFRNMLDPFNGNVVERNVRMEAELGENGYFTGRIKTADIIGRIRFGIALFLRFLQRVFIFM